MRGAEAWPWTQDQRRWQLAGQKARVAIDAHVTDADVVRVDQRAVIGFDRGAHVELTDTVVSQREEIGANRPQLALQSRAVERAAGDVEIHADAVRHRRSEEHTSELQSLMRISYAVFCLKKNTK